MIGVFRRRRCRLLKSGLPGKRDFVEINRLLQNPQNLASIRRLEEAGYLLFLYELGYRLELFEERSGVVFISSKTYALEEDLSK